MGEFPIENLIHCREQKFLSRSLNFYFCAMHRTKTNFIHLGNLKKFSTWNDIMTKAVRQTGSN